MVVRTSWTSFSSYLLSKDEDSYEISKEISDASFFFEQFTHIYLEEEDERDEEITVAVSFKDYNNNYF